MHPHAGLWQGQNACFQYLPTESALELLACEFGQGDVNRLVDVAYHCFINKGDRRFGFYF